MDYRLLGRSGLKVSTVSFGTATFGGVGALAKWGATDAAGARRLLDICLDAGVNTVDTANAYSEGRSEEILGEAMEGRRNRLIVATKVRFPMGGGANDEGLSRLHIVEQCEASLRRLRIDHIDLYQMHQWDGPPRSRRPWGLWTRSSGPARCVMSAPRISRAGI
jgi:aryl-alcohol dehydrogenase-like predicted oxidoreductase